MSLDTTVQDQYFYVIQSRSKETKTRSIALQQLVLPLYTFLPFKSLPRSLRVHPENAMTPADLAPLAWLAPHVSEQAGAVVKMQPRTLRTPLWPQLQNTPKLSSPAQPILAEPLAVHGFAKSHLHQKYAQRTLTTNAYAWEAKLLYHS
jgi:hypothetical protein